MNTGNATLKTSTCALLVSGLLLAGSFSANAKSRSGGSTSSGTSLTLSYPTISAPAGSIAMTAVGSAYATGTGGTTVSQAWNNATRYMYFNVATVYNDCRSRISGGQLVPNGSAIKTSSNGTYTVKQNFYCYSGSYKGWLSSYSASSSYLRAGSSMSSQVCLTQAAPSGGVVVKMISALKRVSVPTSVTIPAGSQCANVSLTGVSASGDDQVFAILNGYAIYIVVTVY